MYIPSSFFSSQGACISASVTTTSGTGSVTSGSFVSASITWSYIQIFNGSDETGPNPVNYNANFTIHSGSTSQAKLLLVGAGGAGGQGQQTICTYSGEGTAAGGGGGGGVVYYDNFTLAPGTYQVSVGVGGGGCGTPGRNGGNTTFNYSTRWSPFPTSLITAAGGGYGGWIQRYPCPSGPNPGVAIWYQGNSGGSAGGNVNINGNGLGVQTQPCCNGLGGLNGANQGFAGGYGYNFANTFNASGGGGAGAAGQAVDQNFQSSPGYGGNGLTFSTNGTSLSYAAGGGAVRAQGFPVINQSSANGVGTAGWGNGGHAESVYYGGGSPGASGTIIIAWPVCLYPTPPRPVPPISGSFPVSASVIYDFGNIISYPTSGSIVYDLSGNNNHGNLTGLTIPAYSASNGGIIRLDSSQLQNVDYSGSFTPNATVVTIWKNFNSTFLVDSGLPDAAMSYGIKAATIGGTKQYTPILYDKFGTSNTFSSATLTPADITIWHQYATIASSSGTNSTATTYLDGSGSSATQTKSLNRSGTSGSGSVFVGKDRDVPGRYSNGYLMGYLQYNRVLTTVELNQIYTTFSTRF